MCDLEKAFGQLSIHYFWTFLSYESEIYFSLIQKPSMTEQLQRQRNLVRKILWYDTSIRLDTSGIVGAILMDLSKAYDLYPTIY